MAETLMPSQVTQEDANSLVNTLNSNLTKSIKSVCPIAEGNTHSAFVAGMVIYIRNHPTLTEGSYTVTQYVAKDATLSDSNVTYNYYGGLDVLNSKIPTFTVVEDQKTTGSTGNVATVYQSTDKVFIISPTVIGTDVYVRAWRASSNGGWYLTAINPNTGATINNTSLTFRFVVVTLP